MWNSSGQVCKWLDSAENAEILLASETGFYCENFVAEAIKALDNAEKLGYEELKKRHIADVLELMNRCVLSIECEDKSGIPTDERLENVHDGGKEVNIEWRDGKIV